MTSYFQSECKNCGHFVGVKIWHTIENIDGECICGHCLCKEAQASKELNAKDARWYK